MFQSTICVVAREDWSEYCRICKCSSEDGDGFEAYLARIEEFHARAKAEGHEVKTVLLRPNELLAWCQAHALEVNSESRKKFADSKLAEMAEEVDDVAASR